MKDTHIVAGERIAGPDCGQDVAPRNDSNLPADRLAYSYGEAARAVGCSARTIWSACASGDLRAARIGRRRVIGVAELRRWLDAKAGIAGEAARDLVPAGKTGGGR